jgi:hypothetical protein
MAERVKAGAGLDQMSQELLDKELAAANTTRGGSGATAATVAQNMSTGKEGQARLQAEQGQVGNWLQSGSTPEDIAYRREQQNLANMGAFVGGRTPQSQFQNLSGAGRGTTPMYQANLPGMNNAANGANAYTIGAWQDQLRAQQNQANPWMAGLSSMLSGAKSFVTGIGGF